METEKKEKLNSSITGKIDFNLRLLFPIPLALGVYSARIELGLHSVPFQQQHNIDRNRPVRLRNCTNRFEPCMVVALVAPISPEYVRT